MRLMAFGALMIIFIGFSLASPYFFTFRNVIGILISTAVNGLLAIGVTFIIITGGIDLSVGTVMTLSAVMSGVFITYWNLPVPLGVMAGILTGSTAGFFNGIMVSKFKLPPFVATLGMLNVARGFSLVISKLSPIYFDLDKSVSSIAMGSILGKIIPGFEIPNAVLIMFGSAIIAGLILSKTILGRYTYAIGSNEKAVQLSGVNIVFWKTAIYTVAGIFIGIAGVVIRRHFTERWRRHDTGHHYRCVYYQYAHKRPAYHVRTTRVADRYYRLHHYFCGVSGYSPPWKAIMKNQEIVSFSSTISL